MAKQKYHLRRMDRAMSKRSDQLAVIRGQKFLTLALCERNQPYLVTLNYGYSKSENCFYVHSATEGKKVAILRANPRVWGQVVEDCGYRAGDCSHAYRSVMFLGRAEFVRSIAEKRRALYLMIDQLEPRPKPIKAKLTNDAFAKGVTILRLKVEAMTGKASPPR